MQYTLLISFLSLILKTNSLHGKELVTQSAIVDTSGLIVEVCGDMPYVCVYKNENGKRNNYNVLGFDLVLKAQDGKATTYSAINNQFTPVMRRIIATADHETRCNLFLDNVKISSAAKQTILLKGLKPLHSD